MYMHHNMQSHCCSFMYKPTNCDIDVSDIQCTVCIIYTCISLHYTHTQPETNIFAYVSAEDFKKIRKVS